MSLQLKSPWTELAIKSSPLSATRARKSPLLYMMRRLDKPKKSPLSLFQRMLSHLFTKLRRLLKEPSPQLTVLIKSSKLTRTSTASFLKSNKAFPQFRLKRFRLLKLCNLIFPMLHRKSSFSSKARKKTRNLKLPLSINPTKESQSSLMFKQFFQKMTPQLLSQFAQSSSHLKKSRLRK